MIRTLMIVCLIFAQPISATPKWLKATRKVAEHLAIGAGTSVAVNQVAGGGHKWAPGLIAAGAVAGFKEGADATAGRDTKKEAAIHALTILAGAGLAIAIKH